MPERKTALTGAAGEHFVAFHLSALGFPVGLTRGGSPTVDLMVGNLSGSATVSIQVKTSSQAWRSLKRDSDKSHWLWDVGEKGLYLRGDSIFYAFVDLKGDAKKLQRPDVFIVPSAVVAEYFNPKFTRFMYKIFKADADKYCERWDLITDRFANDYRSE